MAVAEQAYETRENVRAETRWCVKMKVNTFASVITVRRSLHGICYSNSVCPSVRLSVCLSVCHTRGLCPHGSTYDHDFFTTG